MGPRGLALLDAMIRAWIASEFGVEYDSRSGLVALLHRLGLNIASPRSFLAISTNTSSARSSSSTGN